MSMTDDIVKRAQEEKDRLNAKFQREAAEKAQKDAEHAREKAKEAQKAAGQ